MQPQRAPSAGPEASQHALRQAAGQPQADAVDTYWLRVPAALRRYSVFLAEAWHDGIYLTAWRAAALGAPAAALLFGLWAGATHPALLRWSPIGSQTGQLPIAFTEMLPFMLIAAAAGALSANLGLLLTLGYALADFVVVGPQVLPNDQGTLLTNPALASLYMRVTLLIGYALLLMLAVVPTVTGKYLVTGLRGFPKGAGPGPRVVVSAVVQGALVWIWTASAYIFIRVLWSWAGEFPVIPAIANLQSAGGWIVAAAFVGALARGWLSQRAYRDLAVRARVTRLAALLKSADQRPARTRLLPPAVRALLTAGFLTLLLSAIIASLAEAVMAFLYLAAVLVLRMAVLPRTGIWRAWRRAVTRVPLLLRMVLGAALVYVVVSALYPALEQWPLLVQSDVGSFQPILASTCVSLLVMTVLLPGATGRPQSSRPVPATTGDPLAGPTGRR